MTLTIEIEPETQRVLEAAAQQRGVAFDVYLRDVMREKATQYAPEFVHDAGAGFMAMLQKAQPIIAAGVLRPLTSGDVNSAIDTAREYSNE